MTIQEAINSGKRFRRPMYVCWMFIDEEGKITWTDGVGLNTFSAESLLATDWEVEVIKKELSAEDIRKAGLDSSFSEDRAVYRGFIECLIHNLGLE